MKKIALETSAASAADDAQALTAANPNEILLAAPITRKGGDVAAITLRKPNSGELRGLTISALMQSDVESLIKLLPRISTPMVAEYEAAALDPADMVKVAGVVAGFLLGKSTETPHSPRA
ncbi:hypothetical protein AZ34_10410 [Hylemonella gracilis str. Niagara R]|uniref:Phage tail assembly protein n=1 Tax=Hylemonella gracilis str. Niagara R TaxID=1458275 RepID=A0A016XHR3_9BURK|nr:phage tail assembly protein [Hylemonella gracilis]EYC51445.1 hypothetical protein AZ34_10410 [Hylemonella gracilis str. Niagara R]